MKGSVIALIGAQWGDEGKGRIVDSLGAGVDVFARFQGGANAGHTVIVGKEKYVFHLLPSGMLYAGKTCVIGSGVVFDPDTFEEEITALNKKGMDRARLVISRACQVVMPYHKLLDQAQEKRRESTGHKIGTTGRGIGPCYVDKYARTGIRVEDLLDSDLLRTKLESALDEKNLLLTRVYDQHPLPFDELYEKALSWGRRLKAYVADASYEVNEALNDGQTVLLEGAQGTLLDVDYGTYPMVTSSHTVAGFGPVSLGISPASVSRVIGVVKAYATRVGSGPFPTEDTGEGGDALRAGGGEYGATTGRPRRCGWLDLVALRYAVRINGITELALTKLDVLSSFDTIRYCNGYTAGDGEAPVQFPASEAGLSRVQPVYSQVPGWKTDISAARTLNDLPQAARDYVALIEKVAGVPVTMIGVGSERDQYISVKK